MKVRALLIFFLVLCGQAAFSQPLSPLKWIVDAEKVENDTYLVRATGEFSNPSWHIYDLKDYPGGPNSTVFKIEGEGIEMVGEPEVSSKVRTYYDEVFGMKIGTLEGPVVLTRKIVTSAPEVLARIEWQACREGACLPPEEFEAVVSLVDAPLAEEEGRGGLLGIILAAIAWGFVALLTPCVFPMIPMTVSFFLKQDGRRGKSLALFFGLSIVALYTVPVAILILISLLGGGEAVTADIFNFLATHWIPNLLFFAVFMAFAASFFGAFEITLPSRLVNRSDSRSESGGLVGAFFVAMTLVLVSFSCTGPIVGTVLIKSTQGQFWEPIVTMLAFSIAFSLPFTVFAFAPSLLKKLPRSGGWLGTVKIVLGFVEVALGFKFLSVADQTYHWGLLGRETYLAIWIVVFSLLGFYLLGKIRFKGEAPLEHIGVGRLALVIAVFSFVVYMIPGMWGAPLKALSGYLPPITTQDFVLGTSGEPSSMQDKSDGHKYSDFLALPYSLDAYFDYDEAIEAAREADKPLFVDFTGHGCVNCREMESRVWSDPRALDILRNAVVICALYADDKTPVEPHGTLGKKNSQFALERFGVNAQPYYAVLDPFTEEFLAQPMGYDLDSEKFVSFLNEGLESYLLKRR